MIENIRFENLSSFKLALFADRQVLSFNFEDKATLSKHYFHEYDAKKQFYLVRSIVNALDALLYDEKKKKTAKGYFEIRINVAKKLQHGHLDVKHSEILEYLGKRQKYPSVYFRRVENALDSLKVHGKLESWDCDKTSLESDYLYKLELLTEPTPFESVLP